MITKQVSGTDPHMLIPDQKVTTQSVLGELNDRGVKFLTLRMRSTSLTRQIDSLPASAYTTISLDRSGKHTKPRLHESTEVKLSKYPATVRQLIVTGLDRDAPSSSPTTTTPQRKP